MTAAVLQSNYLPWRGYFDLIRDVDLFVFYDEVQYTTRDWRNRNIVYSKQGKNWLTLPCGNDTSRAIRDVELNNQTDWRERHWNCLQKTYGRAPSFKLYRDFFSAVYNDMRWERLSQLNQYLIRTISAEFLGVKTRFADSADFASSGKKSEKLLSLLRSIGCEKYVSGPSAKSYMREDEFAEAGIEVIWKDYAGYPEYKQRREPFEPRVSVVDLLFHTGPDAPYYIWGWRG